MGMVCATVFLFTWSNTLPNGLIRNLFRACTLIIAMIGPVVHLAEASFQLVFCRPEAQSICGDRLVPFYQQMDYLVHSGQYYAEPSELERNEAAK